ncbi:MAG: response regulator transcription factor [Candidatus Heimdallarchaeota archaeon]
MSLKESVNMPINPKLKIMIVEDDPLIRQLYETILKKKGYDVVAVASDGAQAVTMYQDLEDKPDLIILDFRMPKMNGLQVSREILAENATTEILMISGDPTFDRKAVISRGISLMQKPVEMNEIIREISLIGNL